MKFDTWQEQYLVYENGKFQEQTFFYTSTPLNGAEEQKIGFTSDFITLKYSKRFPTPTFQLEARVSGTHGTVCKAIKPKLIETMVICCHLLFKAMVSIVVKHSVQQNATYATDLLLVPNITLQIVMI